VVSLAGRGGPRTSMLFGLVEYWEIVSVMEVASIGLRWRRSGIGEWPEVEVRSIFTSPIVVLLGTRYPFCVPSLFLGPTLQAVSNTILPYHPQQQMHQELPLPCILLGPLPLIEQGRKSLRTTSQTQNWVVLN
jgi:hypothetical protein